MDGGLQNGEEPLARTPATSFISPSSCKFGARSTPARRARLPALTLGGLGDSGIHSTPNCTKSVVGPRNVELWKISTPAKALDDQPLNFPVL